MKKFSISKWLIYLILLIYIVMCLYPFLLVVGGSFTSEPEIRARGYQIIPHEWSLKAYQLLFADPKFVLNAYSVTTTVTIVGTICSLLITALLAYPLSLRTFRFRRFLSFYIVFTFLFSGGMISWYIITVNYLHLKDTLLALIIPALVSPFNVILFRNYFESLPDEMHESAIIDGAGETMIFFKIIVPLSTPIIATVALFVALSYWNDWWLGIMLIDRDELKPLQILLRSIVSRVNFLKSAKSLQFLNSAKLIPSEGVKLATCLVTIGPIILFYPFVQKYFVKGIMLGAVKG